MNTPADASGNLNVQVTAGLPAGVYRLGSINSAANHQPVLVAEAQHGLLDDVVYFTVGGAGAAAGNSSAAGAGAAAASAPAAASAAQGASAAAASATAASGKAGNAGKGAQTKGKGGKRFNVARSQRLNRL